MPLSSVSALHHTAALLASEGRATVPILADMHILPLLYPLLRGLSTGKVYLFMATSAMAPMPTYTTQNRISRAEITVSMVPPTLRLPG